MNSVLKIIISSVLIIQVLMMPVFTITAIAAQPFDSLGSPIPVQPSASAPTLMHRSPASGTAPGTAAIPYSYQTSNYFSDTSGNILMNVNVWGNVGRPGQVTVPEGSDISTLISLAGGPTNEANLKKVLVNRAYPDENGNMTYFINLDKYAKTGDRSMLIALQPNDTVIIPQRRSIDVLPTVIGIIGLAVSVYAVANN